MHKREWVILGYSFITICCWWLHFRKLLNYFPPYNSAQKQAVTLLRIVFSTTSLKLGKVSEKLNTWDKNKKWPLLARSNDNLEIPNGKSMRVCVSFLLIKKFDFLLVVEGTILMLFQQGWYNDLLFKTGNI